MAAKLENANGMLFARDTDNSTPLKQTWWVSAARWCNAIGCKLSRILVLLHKSHASALFQDPTVG